MNMFPIMKIDESEFAKRTLEYIYSIENSFRECALFINILNPLKSYDDLKKSESYLKERLSKLHFKTQYNEVTFENHIDGFGDDTFEQIRKLGNKRFAIENFSKEIFWANSDEEKSYQGIANFKCFEEKLVSKDKINRTVINAPFNLDGWVEYYKNLLNLKFSDFSDELSLGKINIKYRLLKDDYFLGIETDYTRFRSNFKRDFNEEPAHKLIIFKKAGKKSIDRVLTFEKFINPYFDPPAYSFGWYFYARNTVEVGENELSARYIVERKLLDNGDLNLSMSEVFGEDLKRHVYFYYDMLSHTTKYLIKFIEDSFEINVKV